MAELELHRRGFYTLPDSAPHHIMLLVRLPRSLQRRVLSFMGPSLKTFMEGAEFHACVMLLAVWFVHRDIQ